MGDKFQAEILKKLNAFGDSLLEESEFPKNKKRKKIRDDSVGSDTSSIERKKKKKKRNVQPAAPNDTEEVVNPIKRLSGQQRHLAEIREKLGLTDLEVSTDNGSTSNLDNSQNMNSKGRKRREPEVVVYEDPRRRKEKRLAEAQQKLTGLDSRKSYGDDDSGVEFDLKRARHEIKRFGISGLDKVAKDEAQVQLAIRLGAKPAKQQCVNYKQLIATKKQQKAEERERLAAGEDIPSKSSLSSKSKKLKKKKDRAGFVDGQIGSYKDGVQRISQEDIERLKKRK